MNVFNMRVLFVLLLGILATVSCSKQFGVAPSDQNHSELPIASLQRMPVAELKSFRIVHRHRNDAASPMPTVTPNCATGYVCVIAGDEVDAQVIICCGGNSNTSYVNYFTDSNQPDGVTTTFDPATVSTGSPLFPTTLQIQTSVNSPLGVYPLDSYDQDDRGANSITVTLFYYIICDQNGNCPIPCATPSPDGATSPPTGAATCPPDGSGCVTFDRKRNSQATRSKSRESRGQHADSQICLLPAPPTPTPTPAIQIYDLYLSQVTSGSPASMPTTLIGTYNQLEVQQAPNGAASGTIIPSSVQWSFSPDGASDPILSFDPATDTITTPPPSTGIDTAIYAWSVPGIKTLTVKANMTVNNQEYDGLTASANYVAVAPSKVTADATLGTVLIDVRSEEDVQPLPLPSATEVPPTYSKDEYLTFGYSEHDPQPGISFTFKVAPPPGTDGGVLFGQQLINRATSSSPHNNGYHTTKGFWLDSCGEYGTPTINSWDAIDAPAIELTNGGLPIVATVTNNDMFMMYYMYRPLDDLRASTYVPLDIVSWSWGGTASLSAIPKTVQNPLEVLLYSLSNESQPTKNVVPTSTYPSFKSIYTSTNEDCVIDPEDQLRKRDDYIRLSKKKSKVHSTLQRFPRTI